MGRQAPVFTGASYLRSPIPDPRPLVPQYILGRARGRCQSWQGLCYTSRMNSEATKQSYMTHLECSDHDCGKTYPASVEQHLCECGAILLACYDLDRIRQEVSRGAVEARPWHLGLWRYGELLPLADPADRVTLGEGATPTLPLQSLGRELGIDLWLKDEGLNPTGTFKARGAAVGVSMAKALGATTIALPTAGNAGAAWSAYGARAGLRVVVAMPKDAPPLTQREVQIYGASLHLVDGLI